MSFREEAIELVVSNGYTKLCEVGVWKGELSRMLAKVADELTLVDPMSVEWNNFMHGEFHYTCRMGEREKTQDELDWLYTKIVRDYNLPNVRFLRLPSVQASLQVADKSLDFVYIDAVHTYEHCKQDIEAWLPKIKPGGMIAGDDYVPEHNAVAKAVDELLGTQENRTWSAKV